MTDVVISGAERLRRAAREIVNWLFPSLDIKA